MIHFSVEISVLILNHWVVSTRQSRNKRNNSSDIPRFRSFLSKISCLILAKAFEKSNKRSIFVYSVQPIFSYILERLRIS